MPRDGSGTYTLPAGNPVVSGTIIDVTWANPTMSDVATALTDSLSRTGSGGMLVPFLNADGAVGSPGISWVNESTSGLYRNALNDQRFSSSGVDIVQLTNDANNPLLVMSGGAFRSVLNIFAPYTIVGDWTWEGRLVTDDSTLTRAGFNIPVGLEPTVPVQGDMWVEAGDIFAWINGVAESLIGSTLVAAGTVTDNTLRWTGTGWAESSALTLETGPNRARFAATVHFDTNAQFHTGVSDYVFFSGFSNIYSFAAFGIIDQLSMSGFDFIEFDGPTVKFFELAAPTAGNEASYGQIWVRNDNPPIFVYRDDVGVDSPFNEMGTFTLDWSVGFSDSNVNTYSYCRIGNLVTFWLVTANLGNSNAATMGTSDGIPAALRPPTLRYGSGPFVDNASSIVLATVILQTDGSLDAFAPDIAGSDPPDWGNDWTTSGVKGPVAGFSMTYSLLD